MGGGGGGVVALRYRMAPDYQMGAQGGGGERQNLWALNSFECQKGGGSLYFVNYMIFIVWKAETIWITFVGYYAFRI